MTNNRIELLENFQIFLFVLIPLFLITGPFLPMYPITIVEFFIAYFGLKPIANQPDVLAFNLTSKKSFNILYSKIIFFFYYFAVDI